MIVSEKPFTLRWLTNHHQPTLLWLKIYDDVDNQLRDVRWQRPSTSVGELGLDSRRRCFIVKSNCSERQWALHDFTARVWSVIISNVINTFYTEAGGGGARGVWGGHFVWTCVFCWKRKTDNCMLCVCVCENVCVWVWVCGVSSFHRSESKLWYVQMTGSVCHRRALLSLQHHYNCLVNILAADIDYLANPITEATIDPLASGPAVSTLSKETLNSTCTLGSLTA